MKILIVLILALSSCSTKVAPLELSDISLSKTEVSKVLDIPITPDDIKMDIIFDQRKNPTIARFNNEKVEFVSELSQKITDAVSKTLVNSGFRISNSSNVSLSGFLNTYEADLNGKINSTGSANVKFTLSANNIEQRSSYKAQYAGSATIKTIMASEKHISSMLDKALSSALKQMVKDENLIYFLRK